MDSLVPRPYSNSTRSSPPMACDNCRRRKVRCDRGRPCLKCQDVCLPCSYTSVPQRKGPKGPSARVLSALRGMRTESSSSTATPTPSASSSFSRATLPPTDELNISSPDASVTLSLSSTSLDSRNELLFLPSPARGTQRIPSTILSIHVGLFLQHLYPIMPVIDPKSLCDCTDPETLHPRRYAYLVALSAATHLQLNLDIGEFESAGNSYAITGEDLIAEAVRTLRDFDPLDCPHTETLLTMFFLFCAYGNLQKAGHAWQYLSQAIFFLQFLNMDKEVFYAALPKAEAETRRRIYWLVFITERAYALQTGRPVVLRSHVRKPAVFDSDVPMMLYGFVSLACLFEQIPPEFYDWNFTEMGGPQDSSAINSLYQSIAATTPVLLTEVSEIHKVDLVISQQWLQVRLWNYFARRPHRPTGGLPTQVPVAAGRCVLACLSSVSTPSVDAHGIGMEQKLYDIGESIAELKPDLSPKGSSLSGMLTPPETKDLLKGILDVLSKTRGSQSYLFSSLLVKAQDFLEVNNLPPPLFQRQEEHDLFQLVRTTRRKRIYDQEKLHIETVGRDQFSPLDETTDHTI